MDGQVYEEGDNVGDGVVVSYSSATSFIATGLTGATTYNFFIFAVNNACTGGPKYLTSNELQANATTVAGLPPCTAPVDQPSSLNLTSTTNTIQGLFTASTANEYLVLRSTSSSLSTNPVNGTTYNAGALLGNAVVVQRNAATSFTASGLTPNTNYYLFVFSLNSQNCLNGPAYNTTDPLTGPISTLPLSPCATPSSQPTNLALSAANTSIVGTFNSSASADNYLVIASTSATLISSPSDGTDYNIGDGLGGGKVVANSSSTSFVATNLTASTTYYLHVFASNRTCTGGTKYLVSSPLKASITTTSTPAYQVYFGTLHAHSDYSDGNKDRPGFTPADDYNYAMTAECMDFLGVSEHNHFSSLDNPGNIITNYRKGSVQANTFNASHPNFVAMYGMEWGVISGGGHVVVYGDGMDKLYGWESNVGGVSGNNYDVFVPKSDYTGANGLFKKINDDIQYNTFATLAHPNNTDYNNLSNVAYNAVADNAIVGTAVESGPSTSTNTTYSNPGSSMFYLWYYQKMLSLGYHLGPTIDHDNHNTTFGKTTRARTAVLAPRLTQTELVKAMREMRFYATEDCDTKIDFTVNTRVMGSTFSDRNAPSISIRLSDATTSTSSAKIRIMFGVPGSKVLPIAIDSVIGSSFNFVDNNLAVNTTGYYYADITNQGAKIVTSPIWYTRLCSIATDTIATACNSFTWYGTTYTSSVTTSRQYTTQGGCDSTVTLHLTINTPSSGDTTATACESFNWYGNTYLASGSYTHTLTNVGGCDSTLTLHLVINPKPEALIIAAGPTSFCPGSSVVLTANAAASYLWSNAESTQSITATQTGNYSVTITDVNGCSNTSNIIAVAADDHTLPEVYTRSITIHLNASGLASVTAAQINNGSTDNCAIASNGYVLSKSSFTCSDIGENAVALTVTDVNGNSASASATVTIVDDIAPSFTAPGAQSIALGNSCSIIIPDLTNGLTGSDNCNVVSFTQSPIAGTSLTSSHNQTHTVTVTANDGHGNTTANSILLTAKDQTMPTINAPASITVNNDASKCYASNVSLGLANINDNCTGTTASNNAPLTFPTGNTTVTWMATDAAGNTSTATQVVTVLDNEKPNVTCQIVPVQCYSTAETYTIPLLTATDNCGISNITFTITGATSRSGTGNNATGHFNEGTSIVKWTVTDVSGNTQTCSTTVVINPRLTVSIPDVYAVTPGGNANTIYKGYGPSSLTLNATVTGGTAPYSNKWTIGSSAGSALSSNSSYAVTPTSTTSYYFNVKDVYGCAAPATKKTVQVVDVRCGPKLDRVTVCILQKGSYTTNCVTANSVSGYLSSGGYLGACQSNAITSTSTTQQVTTSTSMQRVQDQEEVTTLTATVLPNPSHYAFKISTRSNKQSLLTVRILNSTGSIVETRNGLTANGSISIGNRYTAGVYFAEIMQGTRRVVLKLIKQ